MSGRKKTALVCAGGGITGGVYEVGVLRSLGNYLPRMSVTDFDLYVGVSAGSMVAAFLANGIPPAELFQSLIGRSQTLPPLGRGDVFRLNWGEFLVRAGMAPVRILEALSVALTSGEELSMVDVLLSLGGLIPSGILDGGGLESYVRRSFSMHGRTDDFRQLRRRLYIPAVDLDTGRRVVFGEPGWDDVPISVAVRASSALPIAFRPTRVRGRDLIDGSTEKNLHLDIAISHGAKLIVAINPIVPILNDPNSARTIARGVLDRKVRIRDLGLPFVLDQAFRMLLHTRLDKGVELVRRDHPDVDVLLIEPSRDDYTMFFYNMMRYSARVIIARHGYESARTFIEERFEEYARTFARHGIELDREAAARDYEQMARERFSLSAIVRTLGTVPILRSFVREGAASRANAG